MSDQEAWHELCDLYLQEQEYSKAAFCMEELILHNPHSHLIHQRYAEIKYSQVNKFYLFIQNLIHCKFNQFPSRVDLKIWNWPKHTFVKPLN